MPFRSALSGLNAAQSELRVIGNNVANAATTGFKKSRTEFADVIAASNFGVSGNAIGSGVRVANISQQFSQGVVSFTDNNLDLAISGGGFFVLDDNGTRAYTRSGNFGIDQSGSLINSLGQSLVAFQADTNGNITGQTGPLQLNLSDIAPKATAAIEVGMNLDANTGTNAFSPAIDPTNPASYDSSTSLSVFDSLGRPHLGTVYLQKAAGAGVWNTELYIDGTGAGNRVVPTGGSTITFAADGTLSLPAGGTIAYNAFAVAPATSLSLTVDYTGNTPSTQYGSAFSVNSLQQDGYTTGRISSIDIAETGTIAARFTNGQTRTMGQVALANFTNPQGLLPLGDNAWAEGFTSGQPLVSAPGTSSLGVIQSGALEGSNVDITEQLVGMITAQRNFQANAQVISTADAITQTIINIR